MMCACRKPKPYDHPTRILIDKKWRFQLGDDLKYAAAGYDDKKWRPTEANRSWQQEGYPRYTGYAWYRKNIFLPLSLIKPYAKDTLELFMGVIYNNDQIYLNGRLLAENGKFLPDGATGSPAFEKVPTGIFSLRFIKIPVNDKRLLWNKDNVLAVRIFSDLDCGGLFAGEHYIQMKGDNEDVAFDTFTFYSLIGQDALDTVLNISNTSFKKTFTGTFSLSAEDIVTHKTYTYQKDGIVLKPNSTFQLPVSLATCTDSVKVIFAFEDDGHRLKTTDSCYLPYILMK
jgi:hypothetical protein